MGFFGIAHPESISFFIATPSGVNRTISGILNTINAMKQSSKRLVSVLAALLFTVVALVMFFDLIEPEYGNVETLKGQLASQQQFLSTETQAVAQAQQIINTYKGQTQEEQNLALAMPSGEELSSAIAQIYGIAANNNVLISGVTISAPTLQMQASASGNGGTGAGDLIKPMGNISFQVAAAGSYENMASFLSQLESNIRIFDLKALTLHQGSLVASGARGVSAGNQDYFNYSMSISAYYELP